MPPLENARHEAFARGIVAGKCGREAYEDAGYKARGPSAEANASRLLGDAKVAARIAELKREAAAGTTVTAARVIEELGRLAFANMADFMRPGPEGVPVLRFSDLTRDQTAALAEVTVDEFIEGRGEDAQGVRRIKFRLADKRAALADLAKHFGLFAAQKHEHSGPDGGPIGTREMSDLDVARRLAFLLDRGARNLSE